MRKAGFEPAWLAPPPPQDGVSANSTTSAVGADSREGYPHSKRGDHGSSPQKHRSSKATNSRQKPIFRRQPVESGTAGKEPEAYPVVPCQGRLSRAQILGWPSSVPLSGPRWTSLRLYFRLWEQGNSAQYSLGKRQ